MKPIYNIEKRKQPKKKANNSPVNLTVKKKYNDASYNNLSHINPPYNNTKYTNQSQAFLRAIPSYPNEYLKPSVNLPESSLYNNTSNYRNILKDSDSDIDFLLSSTVSMKNKLDHQTYEKIPDYEKTLEYKQAPVHSNVENIKNMAYDVKEPVKHTTNIGNISEILKEKEDTLKDIIYNLPNYFYELKHEYTTYKNKYEKAMADLTVKDKTCEEFCRKIEELVEESNKKSENILQLMNENEKLKNDQKFLDTTKNEKDRLVEIFKKDTEEKNREIEQLVEERGRLKCENSKLKIEKEMLERDTRENARNLVKLQTEKNVIRTEIENLKLFVRNTLEKYLQSNVFTEIERIERENRKLAFFQCLMETVKAGVFKMRQDLIRVEREMEACREWSFKMIADQCRYETVIFDYKNQIDEAKKGLSVGVGGILESIRKEIKKIENSTKTFKKTAGIENLQKEFMKMIDRQKSEFEVQKQQYEKKIRELNEKIEEQQDVWKVFE